jgi:hypothetical protein
MFKNRLIEIPWAVKQNMNLFKNDFRREAAAIWQEFCKALMRLPSPLCSNRSYPRILED